MKKETIVKEAELSIIEKLTVNNLPELVGWKEKQQKLVKENPFVAITDGKTYDLACKARTNLLKGRTELQNQEKTLASKIAAFRKNIGEKTKELIDITVPSEDAQQFEVKRWENIKEVEKAEKDRVEALRVSGIKNEIERFETECLELIQKTNHENVAETKSYLDLLVNTNFDFEEFDVLFEIARSRVQSQFDLKCSDIQERETQRLAKEESDRIAKVETDKNELQAERLKQLIPFIGIGEDVDMTTLWSLSDEEYVLIYDSKSLLHFEKEKSDKEIDDARLANEKKEREAIFVIRKNRLDEIGMVYSKSWFTVDNVKTGVVSTFSIDDIDVYNAKTIEFEDIISNAKKSIDEAKEAKDQVEKQAEKELFESRVEMLTSIGFTYDENADYPFFLDATWKCTKDVIEEANADWFTDYVKEVNTYQKQQNEKLSKADATKLKKENADRVKQLKADKDQIKKAIESVNKCIIEQIIFLEFGNEETEALRKSIEVRFEALVEECLTEIEKL